jgi:HAD superfamily hydrolase (TIGR01509 family)
MTRNADLLTTSSEVAIPFGQIDAVLFDVGGTLARMDFDWISRELLALDIVCESARLARAEAAVRRLVSAKLAEENPPAPIFPFFLTSILTEVLDEQAEAIAELVSRLTPVLLPDGKGQKLWSSVDAQTRQALAEFSSLGLRMAVVSNSDGTVEAGMRALGLRDFFDVVIDSAVVGHEKPDPKIFQFALQEMRVDASRAIYVGDLYSVDVVGARAAGIHPVLLDPHGDWGEIDCLTVGSLTELASMFRFQD